MKKRILSLALALSMALGLYTPAFAASYTDTGNHWGKASIERWTDYGIVEGSGSQFNPNNPMTRGEVAKVLANLLGLKAEADIGNYADVPEGAWYRSYMAKCVAAGIFKGVSSDRLAPNTPVTREQMFVLLGRALGITPKATADKQFADGAQVSGWARGYVNAMADRGIVSGVGGNHVAPLADINRASVMAVLDKAITTYVNTDGQTVDAEGGIVLVNASNVTVTGKADNVVVASTNSSVSLSGATVTDVAVVGEGNTVSLTDGATAGTVTVSGQADSATVNVAAGSTVSTVTTAADGVTVAGSGTVEKAEVKGDNTAVNTSGTSVTVADTATGTTENGKPVESGATVETKPAPSTPAPVVPTPGHTHTYEWTDNEDGTHTGTCTGATGTCDAPTVTENHADTNTDGTCDKCGATHAHTYNYTDNADGKTHKGVCGKTDHLTCTAETISSEAHVDMLINGTETATPDKKCDKCGAELIVDEASLIAALNKIPSTGTGTGTVVLAANVTVDPIAFETAIDGKTVIIDLNEKKLTVGLWNYNGENYYCPVFLGKNSDDPRQSGEGAVVANAVDLTIKNGSMDLKNFVDSGANFNINAGSSLTVENVDITSTGTVFYPRGDAAKVDVKGGSITTSGVYAISTNAATVDNYDVQITVDGTAINMTAESKDSCAVMINVRCNLSMKDTTIIAQRQGVIVRAGAAVLDHCTITAAPGKLSWVKSEMYTGVIGEHAWQTGNEMPYGALIVGNVTNGSYTADATVTLTNGCTLSATANGTEDADFKVCAIYAIKGTSFATTITVSDTTAVTGRVVNYGDTLFITNPENLTDVIVVKNVSDEPITTSAG